MFQNLKYLHTKKLTKLLKRIGIGFVLFPNLLNSVSAAEEFRAHYHEVLLETTDDWELSDLTSLPSDALSPDITYDEDSSNYARWKERFDILRDLYCDEYITDTLVDPFVHGVLKYKEKAYQEALRYLFHSSLSLHPTGLAHLGAILIHQNNIDAGVEILQVAVSLHAMEAFFHLYCHYQKTQDSKGIRFLSHSARKSHLYDRENAYFLKIISTPRKLKPKALYSLNDLKKQDLYFKMEQANFLLSHEDSESKIEGFHLAESLTSLYGSAKAAYLTAQCYQKGLGTPINRKLYQIYLVFAADRGCASAQSEIIDFSEELRQECRKCITYRDVH